MKGLVLEGGGMRGMFTCGVIDTLMECGVQFDGIIGVSAGAAFGCNYKSHQIGRALRYNKRFAADRRYMGIHSLVTTGNIVNADFAYHTVPTQYDIFDAETFRQDPTAFYLVCTDVHTGKPVYQQLTDVDYTTLEWIRASASMPGVSHPVEIGGQQLLDGGISDSIPLRFFRECGYEKNLVVLTQPTGYRKSRSLLQQGLLRVFARRYPAIRQAMAERAEMYNAQLDYIAQQESEGHAFVIAPREKLCISRLEKDPVELQRVYDQGRELATANLSSILEYLSV